MPSNRVCVGIVALDNVIYAIGGREGLRGYITLVVSSNKTEAYLPIDYNLYNQPLITPITNNPTTNQYTFFVAIFLTVIIITNVVLLIFYKRKQNAKFFKHALLFAPVEN